MATEHWITTDNGSHILIEGEGGVFKIVGGAGGKLNGTTVSPASMSKARSFKVPEGHHRLSDPVKIERETEKAYGVSNPAYEEARREYEWGGNEAVAKRVSQAGIDAWRDRRSLNWLPKSHATSHDGHVVTIAEWLARKTGMSTIERQQSNAAAFEAGKKRYNELLEQARAAGVPGVRERMKTTTIKQKMREHGVAVSDSAVDEELDFDIDNAKSVKAAGILFLTAAGEALFLKRGAGGDHPGEWCFSGGHTEGSETAEETAIRETVEELGFLPEGTRTLWTRRIANNELAGTAGQMVNPPLPPGDAIVVPGDLIDFTTFLQRVPERFEPALSGEHTGFAWAKPDQPPEPLHPGARIALDRLTMDELGIARAMAAGELASPQRYQNISLFAIRITGTGMAYRTSWGEFVWRDPALYLNDDFLARCNGLSVIWEHPKGATLNSQEFADRVIGSIMLPYILGDEVWGIAKVHDAAAARIMDQKQLSTSPAVVLRDADSTKLKTEDGHTLLIEGKPTLLDHIAICEQGVWDKGGDPVGVARGDSRMPDETEAEKKAREDKARADADAGQKLDRILAGLDSVTKRMDAMEMADKARRDAEEKARADAETARRADAKKRRDEEHEQWLKDDAEQCAKDDAEEEAESKKMREAGEPEEVAADKARHARKDRMKKRGDDAAKKKADDDAKAKADAEARAKQDDDTAKRVADALAHLPKRMDESDAPAFADAQARADAVYRLHGSQAPGAMQGEDIVAYRRRLARGMQKHSKAWAGIDLIALPPVSASGPSALDNAESMIYADAAEAARNPVDLPDDRLIEIPVTNPVTGLRSWEFRGKHTFIHGLKRPSTRVVRIGKEA